MLEVGRGNTALSIIFGCYVKAKPSKFVLLGSLEREHDKQEAMLSVLPSSLYSPEGDRCHKRSQKKP